MFVSVPTIRSLSWSAREWDRMRLLVFVFLQVLHVPVCVDEHGWLCIEVNMYCMHVFMCVRAGNTRY